MAALTPDLSPLAKKIHPLIGQGRTVLLPALHAAQDMFGYIPENAARVIAQSLKVPLADVFGVIDFYSLFHREPVSQTILHICSDPACAMAGSDSVFKLVQHRRDEKGDLIIERAPCMGLCEFAPALMIEGSHKAKAKIQSYEDLVAGHARRPKPLVGGDIHLLTANCGKISPTGIVDYRSKGGYKALAKALKMSPADVISEVKASGLVGRGGAAFPTGTKWESAAAAPGSPKYLVCNADEAEPGTFKDRVMIEGDPHRVIEGVIIAAYAIGARRAYIYIRGEYIYPFEVMTRAVAEARAAGLVGDKVLGSEYSLEIELRRGAGAYICGEETALFESIEGKRGLPRMKPPFPTTHGLFGKPTVINNVETLANIPTILQLGASGYRAVGTEKSPGTKLFCLSGDVQKPGLYEVAFGTSIRHLLFDLAGGVRGGRKMQAALLGGAAGAFATEKDLDIKLSFEDLRAAGLPLGSGVITVMDETRDLKDILLRLTRFFSEESCGKCYPCQIGTRRQHEIMQRFAANASLPGDLERLKDVGWTMTDASLCGLGQTAASALLSAVKLWPHMFASRQEKDGRSP